MSKTGKQILFVAIVIWAFTVAFLFGGKPIESQADGVPCISSVTLSTSGLNRRDMAFILAVRKNGLSEPTKKDLIWAWNLANEYADKFHELGCN